MHATTSTEAAPRRSASATRDRILEASSRLFYAQGIRATSADRIIEEVGITKVTFYRHFHTKSDLTVAYLTQQAAMERGWFEGARVPGEPAESLRAIAAGIGTASCSPGFRGCAFINAAAEFANVDDPVRTTVNEHRAWMIGEFASIATEAGASDAEQVARTLMMLRDGAMVNGYLGDADGVAQSLAIGFNAALVSAVQ